MSTGSKPGGSVKVGGRDRGRSRLSRREKSELIERLRRDGAVIADHFELEYKAIEAEDPRVKRRYGSCHGDGRIKIRLVHARTGKPLKYSSMIDTLCHELAHLRYFHHGPRFRAFYQRILEWAREAGIYRPTPRKVAEPEFAGVLAAINDPQSIPSGGLVHAAASDPDPKPGEPEKKRRKPPARPHPKRPRKPLREYEQLWLFGQ